MDYPEEWQGNYLRVTKKLLYMIKETNDTIFEICNEFIMVSLKKGNLTPIRDTNNQSTQSEANIQDVFEQSLFTKSILADIFEDEDGYTYIENPEVIYENFSVAYKIIEQSIINMRKYINQVDKLTESVDPEESAYLENYLSMEAENTITKWEKVMKKLEQANAILEVEINS
ncbi:hypothetical protein [Halobacillus faecis]|uniref:Uncharacterized protein n=1 Tax=Halobacillus faecis TaxID=360184 RepID=A0A511WTZ0_9BACI|nr:hypothetical protein [Halobacillus faecis]GEN54605.1 hypothetical protein HFA01_28670 [Halobacillus faecis]